jgi:hypothetical protein
LVHGFAGVANSAHVFELQSHFEVIAELLAFLDRVGVYGALGEGVIVILHEGGVDGEPTNQLAVLSVDELEEEVSAEVHASLVFLIGGGDPHLAILVGRVGY